MADNAAKARRKFEDAEKKTKGGAGFLSGLFGGSKADEAADLFIQDGCSSASSGADEFFCTEHGCYEWFTCVALYENHYNSFHRNRCSVCQKMFINDYCLNLHVEEMHSSIFKSVTEKWPSGAHYKCFIEICSAAFTAPEERINHASQVHGMQSSEVVTVKRKSAKREIHSDSLTINRRKAGNLFKVSKLWKEAGDSFVRAAELHANSSDRKHDTASNYAEAANCFRKVKPELAVECLLKTAEIYTDMGRFNMAAKNHCAIAEIFEKEYPDVEQSILHYTKAADYYKGEESRSSATKCLIKVAQYAAELEQYKKAIQVLEEIALWEADHSTLKYAAKNHFFQALLCYLCVDVLDTQHALKRYEEVSPSFSDTREAKLIRDLILCLEEENQDQLTDAVKDYDKISRLDQWHTTMLVRIKRLCGSAEEDDLK